MLAAEHHALGARAPAAMNFLGTVTAHPDPPGIDLERWRQLIAAHPSLEPVAPKLGVNPFTREPFTYSSHPGTAWVVIGGRQAGMMSWAEDGTNQIAVWGESDAIDEIATQVAVQLGGAYGRGAG
jgi:hypothetical protein